MILQKKKEKKNKQEIPIMISSHKPLFYNFGVHVSKWQRTLRMFWTENVRSPFIG